MRNHITLIAALILTIWGVAFCSIGFAQDDIEFIPGEDNGFYYTIKKGDTLWDLSQKFYNSQWDWPGLWEMNDDIKNPHWIYPGKKIKIFLKEKGKLKPIVVPVKKVKKEVVVEKVKPSFSFSEMDSIGFIREDAQPSLGTILKEQDGHMMASTDDIVYIKPSDSQALVPGKTYHIFNTSKVKEKLDDKKFSGLKHLIKAQVKILEHKDAYVIGLITKAYRTVFENDMIMEYYKRDSILTVVEDPEPINARIVCSEDNNLMINDYRIAFINLGEDTVEPGQIYSVYKTNEVKGDAKLPFLKKETMKLENLETGKLIVLHTEDISSTVMILSSKYAIHPDDIVN